VNCAGSSRLVAVGDSVLEEVALAVAGRQDELWHLRLLARGPIPNAGVDTCLITTGLCRCDLGEKLISGVIGCLRPVCSAGQVSLAAAGFGRLTIEFPQVLACVEDVLLGDAGQSKCRSTTLFDAEEQALRGEVGGAVDISDSNLVEPKESVVPESE
jgi:hypothetical protein